MFNESTCFIRDENLFEAVDKLASAVVTKMILFAIVDVTVFLEFV